MTKYLFELRSKEWERKSFTNSHRTKISAYTNTAAMHFYYMVHGCDM